VGSYSGEQCRESLCGEMLRERMRTSSLRWERGVEFGDRGELNCLAQGNKGTREEAVMRDKLGGSSN
jgi:hypothetical protein